MPDRLRAYGAEGDKAPRAEPLKRDKLRPEPSAPAPDRPVGTPASPRQGEAKTGASATGRHDGMRNA